MKEHFRIQFKILNRYLIDFGLPLWIGYPLIAFVFILFSTLLLSKTEYAIYVYVSLALFIVLKTSDPHRSNFLQFMYKKETYRKIRIAENLLLCLPFSLFLIYKEQYGFALILNFTAALMTLLSFNFTQSFTIPTPFSKKPFEFTVGFRKTFFIFPIPYFLTFMSLSVGNLNLGIFSILLIAFVCFTYYSEIENTYYVWTYSLSPKKFLIQKIKTCLIYYSVLCVPVILALCIGFLKEWDIILMFFLASCVYLIAIICAKYSSFPDQMNISQVVLILSSLLFPPMLIIFIPFFYFQSLKKLNAVLND